MAYRYFTQEGDAAAEKSEIVEVEVVAGIDSQSEASCHSCRFGKGGYSCFGVAVVGVGVWLGVQLYAVGSGGCRRAYYVGIGVDEDRASYAGFLETFDERRQEFGVCLQPADDVRASGASGTNVTCVGRTLSTRSTNSGVGFPSILNSERSSGRRRYTSSRRMWRSSGRGWTVMPSAPKRSMSSAASVTHGRFSPRALRKVAILFMLTLKFVILCFFASAVRKKNVILYFQNRYQFPDSFSDYKISQK